MQWRNGERPRMKHCPFRESEQAARTSSEIGLSLANEKGVAGTLASRMQRRAEMQGG
jgi:hypothetical protein